MVGTQKIPVSGEISDTQIERLAAVCRVWGAIDLFHPWLVYRDIDWDAALIESLPAIIEATSREKYLAAVRSLLARLDDPNTTIHDSDPPPPSCSPASSQPFVQTLEDDIALITLDYPSLLKGEPMFLRLLRVAQEIKPSAFIVDLRGPDPQTQHMYGWWMAMNLERALPGFVTKDIPVSSSRHRMHSGYALSSRTGYYSAVVTSAPAPLPGRREGSSVPLAFLLNRFSWARWEILSGLQAAGRTVVVWEGEWKADPGVDAVRIPFTEDLSAYVRVTEMLNPDDSLGFVPDAFVPEHDNAAIDMARALVTGAGLPTANDRRQARAYVRENWPRDYRDLDPVPTPYRLLGLFRLWNVIHYFFAYRDLMDRPWEDVLREYIPRILAAETTHEYALVLAECATHTHDGHVGVQARALASDVGTHVPAVAVRDIEGQSVVTNILQGIDDVAPGDIVIAVDGVSVEERREQLARIIAASTPQGHQDSIHQRLLAGPDKSACVIRLRDASGAEREVTLIRTIQARQLRMDIIDQRASPLVRILPSGLGYIDLERLTPSDIDEALAKVSETPGLIFDMRGYPRGVFEILGSRLAQERRAAALFSRPEPHNPSLEWTSVHSGTQYVESSGLPAYTAPIAVLIDERAISQSEHTCLFLKAAANVTFVGTATNGTNGDVTETMLPGDIVVTFTGHDVRHPDGTQLQRIGIQPDVPVAPSIAGLRAGRDEVLEAAEEYLLHLG